MPQAALSNLPDRMAAPAAEQPGRPVLILGSLWLLVFSVTSQTMILAPILPRIAEQLRVSETRLGMLITGYAVAVAVVALLVGPLSDKWGRRKMLLAGSALMTAGLALHAAATGYTTLLLVRIFTGAGGGVLTGAAAAYVGDRFPHERRGWANGWLASGMAAGQILGIPLGTLLAARYGFQLPFVAFAATMALSFATVWWFVPEPRAALYQGRVSFAYLREHYAALLARREIWAALATYLAVFLGVSLFVLFFPTWLEERLGATPGQVATLFALGGVATVIAGPAAGWLSDRVGRKRIVIGASLALFPVLLATVWVVHGIWVAHAFFFLLMACSAARGSPFQALLTELVPAAERGSLMSASMAVGQTGAGIGAAAAGAAFAAWGYVGNTVLAALTALLVAGLAWRFVPEPVAEDAAP